MIFPDGFIPPRRVTSGMDEDKVESLRDTFEEVTGETSVREEGGVERGTLRSTEEVAEDVRDVVAEVEDEHGLPEGVSLEDAVDVVFGYFDGEADDEVAGDLSVDAATVEDVRRALCLLHDDEEASEELERRDRDGRYSIRLDSMFPESDITGRLTEAVEESGLREATEDSEVETEF